MLINLAEIRILKKIRMSLFAISQAEFVIKLVFGCSRKQYQNDNKKNKHVW